MMIEVEQTYQEKFDMYMASEKEELVKMLIECNKHLKVGARIEYDIPFPQKYTFLEDRFVLDSEEEVFKSKSKWRGLGAGDDKTLYIYTDEFCTNIWWKENRGYETTIFDGKELKTEEEFNQVFELLGIKEILKWI